MSEGLAVSKKNSRLTFYKLTFSLGSFKKERESERRTRRIKKEFSLDFLQVDILPWKEIHRNFEGRAHIYLHHICVSTYKIRSVNWHVISHSEA